MWYNLNRPSAGLLFYKQSPNHFTSSYVCGQSARAKSSRALVGFGDCFARALCVAGIIMAPKNRRKTVQVIFNDIWRALVNLDDVPGIYAIVNNARNEMYVGQSERLRTRLMGHFRLLEERKHDNPRLQEAFDRDGIENFTFTLLDRCYADQLNYLEQYWIDRLHPSYNRTGKVKHGYMAVEGFQCEPRGEEKFTRPDWHKYVYGGCRRKYGKEKSGKKASHRD